MNSWDRREARRDRADAKARIAAADYLENGYHPHAETGDADDRAKAAAYKRLRHGMTIAEWNAYSAAMTAEERAEYTRVRRATS